MTISARAVALDGVVAPIRPIVVAVCGLVAAASSTTSVGYPRAVRLDAPELVAACDVPVREARPVELRCAVVVEQATRCAIARETAWGIEVEVVARGASARATASAVEIEQFARALAASQVSLGIVLEQATHAQRAEQAARTVVT